MKALPVIDVTFHANNLHTVVGSLESTKLSPFGGELEDFAFTYPRELPLEMGENYCLEIGDWYLEVFLVSVSRGHLASGRKSNSHYYRMAVRLVEHRPF